MPPPAATQTDAESEEAKDRSAIQRFIAAYAHLGPAPANLFSQTNTEHMVRMADAQESAIQHWVRDAPKGARTAIWETTVFPRQALREYGRTLGFNLLRCSLPTYHQDLPTLLDNEGLYGTISAFPTFAFLLQNELQRHTSPSIDMHVLCKGVHEFNHGMVMPLFRHGGYQKRLITYVHTEHNLSSYIAALLESKAFRDAVNAPRTNDQVPLLRRIVIPIMIPGHFFLFGWDRHFLLGNGEPRVRDRLFTVSTVADRFLHINQGASADILRELRRQLEAKGFLFEGPKLTMHLIRTLTQMSMRSEFRDTACVFHGILFTLFLAMVEDIDDNPALANPEAWHTFRAGYAAYESRLLQLLQSHSGNPVLLGPEWDETFLNVRDARLITVGHGPPLVYSWDRGWAPHICDEYNGS